MFFFCHSETSVTARFVFRAQDNNMTNGDFAIFTHQLLRSSYSDRMWKWYGRYADGPYDERRRRLAFYAIKQVCKWGLVPELVWKCGFGAKDVCRSSFVTFSNVT